MGSGFESCDVEQYEDDFEERDPDKSGGEPGALAMVVMFIGETSREVVSDRLAGTEL